MNPRRITIFAVLLVLTTSAASTQARTVYRCLRDGNVSPATAPEPGSHCVEKHFEGHAVKFQPVGLARRMPWSVAWQVVPHPDPARAAMTRGSRRGSLPFSPLKSVSA